MKRDMNLIRKILLAAEAIPKADEYVVLELEGYPAEQVTYHTRMLLEEGLLREKFGAAISMSGGVQISGQAMTFAGHDFLDAARNDTIWRTAMDKIGGAVGSVSMAVLKGVLEHVTKQQLGISP